MEKNPQGITFSADSRYAFIANTDSNTVSVVDTTTYQVVKSIPVDRGPVGLAYKAAPAAVEQDAQS